MSAATTTGVSGLALTVATAGAGLSLLAFAARALARTVRTAR